MEYLCLLLVLTILALGIALLNAVLGLDILVGVSMSWISKLLRQRSPHISERVGLGNEISAPSALNDVESALTGRIGVVETPIRNGCGRIKVGNSSWTALGEDAEVGSPVRIDRVEDNRLHVTPEA